MSYANDIQVLRREAKNLKDKIKDRRAAACDSALKKSTGDVATVRKITWKPRKLLMGHLAKVCAVDWSSDSRRILSAAQDGAMMIWDGYQGLKVCRIGMRNLWVMGCAYAASGELVAHCGLDQQCTVFKVIEEEGCGEKVAELKGKHDGFVSACKFINDSSMLTCSGDSSSALWDIVSQKVVCKFTGHTGAVMGMALSPSMNTLVTASSDSTVKLWDLRNKDCLQTFGGHEGEVNSVTFFPSGQAFATASEDGTCKFFDIRADQEIATYSDPAADCSVTSVLFTKSGRLLLGGFDNYQCCIWDTLKTGIAGALCGHSDRISSVGVTSDGKALATGSWDSSVLIWN